MKKRRIAGTAGGMWIIFMLLYASLSFAAGPTDRTADKKGKCPVCGMRVAMFADWNAEIVFKDGETVVFDGAKDMFKYYLDLKKYDPSKTMADVAAVSVKDYYSGDSIDALAAYFVIWSDTYGPMGHEPIPFGKETDAVKFLKEHKGRKVLRFMDITQKLLYALDNP